MKIVVTGSNGFLGTYFKNFTRLNEDDILFLTTSESLNKELICKPMYEDIEVILNQYKIDVIIHMASIIPSSFSSSDYALFLNNNKMMNNLYNFSVKNKIKKFIYLSGFGSMNNPKTLDIKDFYTMSKVTGEHFCSMMETKGIETASFRISAPYGEYARARTVLNIFIDKAMRNETIEIFGSGQREQNFTYVGDIINAIELSLENEISGVYNIVSNKNTSMLELANTIIKLTDSSSDLIIGKSIDPQESYAPNYDYTKAKQDLGYEPRYTLEQGLSQYIKWLKK